MQSTVKLGFIQRILQHRDPHIHSQPNLFHLPTYTSNTLFIPTQTAKLTAFIGTTFKYPIPNPT